MTTTSRRISQKMKGNKSSHTPGKLKGESCKADWRKRFFLAHDNKAYKHKDYTIYYNLALSMNGQKVK